MATDLFVWLDALWNKSQPQGTPPIRMMHRFLASDKDYAPWCREFQQHVKEAPLVFRIWQGMLGTARGMPSNPRLSYVGVKKPPAEEELITRMKAVLAERREVVEQMVAIVQQTGRINELYSHFGVKAPR